ncbi:NAD(P)H-binding protein [Nonomuraea sp. MCN248]|uniref:NAD(P)H-binding protein n=1 Tax=Nonomuraea corallina TaxID=2989783 RepID=A0ABT4S4I9_9ACTN|nr:NAD(P)H-binding protein [Nonomuraea corallina]MDA0631968.1 NAD(P)H-binding protein [Nonomuraea corallina]
MATILVLGGTGKTGRRVAAALRARGVRVRAASRRGETPFDWHDHDTWAPALSGVSAAYLVDSQGPEAAELLAAFAGAAIARGVRRLVLLSSRDWPKLGDERLLASERAVKRSGGAWTILRPTWFAQNFSEDPMLSDPVEAGRVELSAGHGLEPFVHAGDIADVAAEVLLGDGHAGRTYELSGPRLLSFGDAVAEIAAATGRRIAYVPVPPEEYAARLSARGYAADEIRLVNRLLTSIAAGVNAHLSDGVRQVLGRDPRDFAEYVRSTW